MRGVQEHRQVEGQYLYCIADDGTKTFLGPIGFGEEEVFTLPYRDLCAVVHRCPAEPYQSQDEEQVKEWIMTHQRVVEMARERFGTVLPCGFDTIVKGEEGSSPEVAIEKWLEKEYHHLRTKMDWVRGKAEYGVQVFWDPQVIASAIARDNSEIQKIQEEMRSRPPGVSYLYRQKLDKALRQEMEARGDEYFRDFYQRMKKHAVDLRIGKTKRGEKDRQMVMNLSCLVEQGAIRELGDELEKIQAIEGIAVRLTGPWPPYTFVAAG